MIPMVYNGGYVQLQKHFSLKVEEIKEIRIEDLGIQRTFVRDIFNGLVLKDRHGHLTLRNQVTF